MTLAPPAPTLRCLSCGYDIASLIETRGRDEPGVCPECGEDLRPSLEIGRGIPWQKRPGVRTYTAFVWASIRSPSRVASQIRLERDFDGLIPLHCVAYPLVLLATLVPVLLLSGAMQYDDPSSTAVDNLVSILVLFLVLGAGAGAAHLLIAGLLWLSDRISRHRASRSALYAATAIGGAWIAAGGFVMLGSCFISWAIGFVLHMASPSISLDPSAVYVVILLSFILPFLLAALGASHARRVFVRLAPPPNIPPHRT